MACRPLRMMSPILLCLQTHRKTICFHSSWSQVLAAAKLRVSHVTSSSPRNTLRQCGHRAYSSHTELDMAILGQLQASVNSSPAASTIAWHRGKEREKGCSSFHHLGMPVCCTMFKVLHGIGEKRLKNLSRSLKQSSLTPRLLHGNVNRKPVHALSFASTKFIVTFLHNYAEQHALLLPGRVPGYSWSDIQLLPSSVSKRAIWKVYHTAEVYPSRCLHHILLHLEEAGTVNCSNEAVIRSFFGNVNKTALPSCARPTTQRLISQLQSLVHLNTCVLSNRTQALQERLSTVQTSVHAHFSVDGQFPHHPKVLAYHAAQMTSKCTTPSITHSKCTFRLTLCNLAPFIFLLHESVRCLGSAVRQYHTRLSFSQTRQDRVAKGLTL